MQLADIKDVLTFAAFRPEPDNGNAAWSKRFAGKRHLLLNINRTNVSWRSVSKRGAIEDAGQDEGEFRDLLNRHVEEWRSMTEQGWVGVSINQRFMITLERNLSRKKGYRETIRKNPKTVIGGKFDRGKSYGIYHSPETNSSLLLACDESFIRSVEEGFRAVGLRPARIAAGLFSMIQDLAEQAHRSKEWSNVEDLVLVAACEGSVCALRQRLGQWTELRCRSGLDPSDPGPALQVLSPFLSGASPQTRLVFMNSEPNHHYGQALLERMGSLIVEEVTEDNQLWRCLTAN